MTKLVFSVQVEVIKLERDQGQQKQREADSFTKLFIIQCGNKDEVQGKFKLTLTFCSRR